VARRTDPARIFQAFLDAIRNRFIGTGLGEATAEARIAAWDSHAARDGLERGSTYWEAAWQWIAKQCERRTKPEAK
jgi:hypothetical protein